MKGETFWLLTFVVLYLVLFHLGIIHRQVVETGLALHFVDVGQGDAVVIEKNGQPVALIDGGGNYEVDYYILNKFGLNCHFPLAILSHAHDDHSLGLRRSFYRCTFDIVLQNRMEIKNNDVDQTKSPGSKKDGIIQKNNVKKTLDGTQFVIENVLIKIFVPNIVSEKDLKNINNQSIVAVVKQGDFEALFLGDLEIEGQEKLDVGRIGRFISGRLDVLKVSHHGAVNGYFPALVEELNPRICVVSVGADNTFGHPSPDVVTALEESGCDVIRTDTSGTVVIRSN